MTSSTLRRLGRLFRKSAESLDPQKADPRAFDAPHGSPFRPPPDQDERRPEDPPLHPDAKELEREHRGY